MPTLSENLLRLTEYTERIDAQLDGLEDEIEQLVIDLFESECAVLAELNGERRELAALLISYAAIHRSNSKMAKILTANQLATTN